MRLDIIWTFGTTGFYEYEWIKDLFSNFEIHEHLDVEHKFDLYFDNSIIVVFNINSDRFREYLSTLQNQGKNFLIYHVGDEALNHDVSYYYEYKDRIVRNYFKDDYHRNGIMTVPLGYKTGLSKKNTEKKYIVNFIGHIKSDRQHMLEHFTDVDPKYIRLTSQWNDPNGLNIDDYSKYVSESFFTLCPAGFASVDSFRINEALECGSCPVSIKYGGIDYFEKIYGPNPFLVGQDWTESLSMIYKCNFTEKQKEIEIWWREFKQSLKKKLQSKLLQKQ